MITILRFNTKYAQEAIIMMIMSGVEIVCTVSGLSMLDSYTDIYIHQPIPGTSGALLISSEYKSNIYKQVNL